MNYNTLRLNIYRNEIKQLLAAISRFGVVMAILFINVLVGAFLMGALMAVGIIAQKDTSIAERIVYQAIYLILMFALVKVQAKAILGTAYRHYLNDMPIKRWQKMRCDMELLAIAGNLALLAPIGLCFFIPDLKTLFDTLYFVMFTLMVIFVGLIALYRSNIPLISLIAAPFFASLVMPDATILNLLWLMSITFELWLVDRFKLHLNGLTVKHYWQMLMMFSLHRPVNFIARALGAMALIGSYGYVVKQRPDFAVVDFQLAVCLPVALIIGSYQFEIERFREQYGYYLCDLPLSNGFRRLMEILPIGLLGAIPVLLGVWGYEFAYAAALFQLTLIALTAVGVVYWGKFYFLLSLVPGVLVIYTLQH